MNMKDMSVAQLAALTASDAPAPGGGSIAALSGAYAAALAAMVASLTLGKKGYEEVQGEMKQVAAQAETLREELLEAIQKDSASFDAYMAALGLPKETEEQKTLRRAAMQEALKEAAQVPYHTAELAAAVLPLAETVVRLGNSNAVTDGLVSAMMARTAVRGALLNVKINLDSIKDEDFTAQLRDKCNVLEGQVIAAETHVLSLQPQLAYCGK